MMSHNRKDRVRKRVSREMQSPLASEEIEEKPTGQVGAAELCCPDKHEMEDQPEEKPESPGSPESLKSEGSLDLPINFNQEGCEELPKRLDLLQTSCFFKDYIECWFHTRLDISLSSYIIIFMIGKVEKGCKMKFQQCKR